MCESTRQLLARVSSTKNIFVTESEASQPDGRKNIHAPCLGGRVLGMAAAVGQAGTVGRAAPRGREWSAQRNCPECVRPLRSRGVPGPPAASVLLRPSASGHQNRNKNKQKLKDNCQAGEDDDNHLSTFSCAYCLCRNSGNGQKCTKVTCLTSEDRKILFVHGGRSPCEICKQRYKIL